MDDLLEVTFGPSGSACLNFRVAHTGGIGPFFFFGGCVPCGLGAPTCWRESGLFPQRCGPIRD